MGTMYFQQAMLRMVTIWITVLSIAYFRMRWTERVRPRAKTYVDRGTQTHECVERRQLDRDDSNDVSAAKLFFSQMTCDTLRNRCRLLGIPRTGLKRELVDRLVNARHVFGRDCTRDDLPDP